MKFSIQCFMAAAVLSSHTTSAFQTPRRASVPAHAQRFGGSVVSPLSATTLEDWQLLDNGSVVGSVRGHPDLNDGDVITTSPLANPAEAGVSATVATMTGSEYTLGTPMTKKAGGEEGTLTRGQVIKAAGLAALTAGGFAFGLTAAGTGGGGSVSLGGPQMSVPEARIAVSFPGAKTNSALVKLIGSKVNGLGYGSKNTLVATSLCCDEVNRPLEKALASAYDEPFLMGGLAGFPFGGVTSFGAMAHHIPDGGNCLVVFGPHVGIDQYGTVGTVNRRGRAKGGACCGSAAAALAKIRKGAMVPAGTTTPPPATDSLDAQQAYVDTQLAPYGERLLNADDRNVELPYTLYEAQKKMMDSIVAKGAGAIEGDGQIALLGGIQINTPEGLSDYFLPLSFELRDKSGAMVQDFMAKPAPPVMEA